MPWKDFMLFYAIDLNVVNHKDALKFVYSIVKFERKMKYAAQWSGVNFPICSEQCQITSTYFTCWWLFHIITVFINWTNIRHIPKFQGWGFSNKQK